MFAAGRGHRGRGSEGGAGHLLLQPRGPGSLGLGLGHPRGVAAGGGGAALRGLARSRLAQPRDEGEFELVVLSIVSFWLRKQPNKS